MFKYILIFVLSIGATTRSIQVHPAGVEVIVSGPWIWPTHCITDTTFMVSDGDTVFFIRVSSRSTGYVDFKGLRDTLIVSKDTVISH